MQIYITFSFFYFQKLGKLQAANRAASISYEQELETTTEKVRSSIDKKSLGVSLRTMLQIFHTVKVCMPFKGRFLQFHGCLIFIEVFLKGYALSFCGSKIILYRPNQVPTLLDGSNSFWLGQII